jgi:hypothetical protein
MLQRMGGGRRESSLHRILRFSSVAGGLVLLLADCGAHGPVTGTHANTPNPVSDASTPAVGTVWMARRRGTGAGCRPHPRASATSMITLPGAGRAR